MKNTYHRYDDIDKAEKGKYHKLIAVEIAAFGKNLIKIHNDCPIYLLLGSMGIYLRDFCDFDLLVYCLSQSVACVWVCRSYVSVCCFKKKLNVYTFGLHLKPWFFYKKVTEMYELISY